jgi:hypothetical protein
MLNDELIVTFFVVCSENNQYGLTRREVVATTSCLRTQNPYFFAKNTVF